MESKQGKVKVQFVANAHFVTSKDGEVDCAVHASHGGTYNGEERKRGGRGGGGGEEGRTKKQGERERDGKGGGGGGGDGGEG